MNIGVIGGTFDPVHSGHLAIAEAAYTDLKLAEVIFIPAGYPYFKDLSEVTSAEHRVKMLKLALEEKPHFKISFIEIDRSGPSYAFDTISNLKAHKYADDEIFFILGWDTLISLPRWYEPKRLLALCRFAAAPRPGFLNPDTSILEKELPGISERTVIMKQPLIDISSSEIRERIRLGLSVDKMVPLKVVEYIRSHNLYKDISK
jgi:nicotinate-nucleotide adenylyltransferase